MKVKEIVDDMRRITMLTGEISSLHIKNLQNWSFVAFDSVRSVEIDYDLTKETTQDIGEGYVTFKLNIEENSTQTLLEKRCETLTSWVRDMFWPEIKVAIYFNGVNQYTDSTIKTEANDLIAQQEKPYNEAAKEVKKGPQHGE